MPSATCGWCSRFSNLTKVGPILEQPRRGFGQLTTIMGSYSCDYCNHLLVGVYFVEDERLRYTEAAELIHEFSNEVIWHPRTGVGKEFPDVPQVIADGASEVHACLSIGAARAAVALARAVLEAAAKEQGVEQGTLEQKIDKLHDRGLIRENVREVAHELRLNGNEVAHGDLVAEPITLEDAQDVADLLDEMLHDLYQSGARMNRVKRRRAERQDAEAPDRRNS